MAAVTCGFTIFPPLAEIDYEMSTAIYVCIMKYNNVTGQIYFIVFAVVGFGLEMPYADREISSMHLMENKTNQLEKIKAVLLAVCWY